MKIAHLHSHLNPGTITTVIKNQLEAVSNNCETLVLASSPPPGGVSLGADVIPVPLAACDDDITQAYSAGELAQSIHEAIRQRWPEGCDVLHIHNPTIAANPRLNNAIKILAEDGVSLFLQIHQFAEAGRPGCFFKEEYPENVHYGVGNTLDYSLLKQAGLKDQGLHLIHNPIIPLNTNDTQIESRFSQFFKNRHLYNNHQSARNGRSTSEIRNTILYPVQAHRRKNIGEALLLSLFFPFNLPLSITQSPHKYEELQIYRKWKSFSQDERFNVQWEVGVYNDLLQLIKEAPFIITTSIDENHGISFLEPWTAATPVFGRYLSQICPYIMDQGIRLDHFYRRFDIPLEFFDRDAGKVPFKERWSEAFFSYIQAFCYTIEPESIEQAYRQLTEAGSIDFGVLDESAQMEVLEYIKDRSMVQKQLIQLNPHLATFLRVGVDDGVITRNNEIIRREYSLSNCRDLLMDIYGAVTTTKVVHKIQKEILLESFLDPRDFKMLKWQKPEEAGKE